MGVVDLFSVSLPIYLVVYTCIILPVSQRCLYSGRFIILLHEIFPQFLAAIYS